MTTKEKDSIAEKVEQILQKIGQEEVKIRNLKFDLEMVQRECSHDGVEEYRDRRTGKCPICQHKFMDKSQIDAIYSD